MPSVSAPAAIIGAGVLGAGASVIGSSNAAQAQESAAQQATAAQQGMFGVTQQNLEPYNQTGQNALQKANNLAGTFNFNPTMAQISQTPGFQFENYFGQQGVNNAAASRGLANSGAALKGAANYAQGLASTDWQNYFNANLGQYQANLGGLQNLANTGEAAAAGVGAAAQQTGSNIGQNITGAGNAAAAGYNTAAGAIGNGLSSIPSGLLTQQAISNQNSLINGLYGNQNNALAVPIPTGGFLGGNS